VATNMLALSPFFSAVMARPPGPREARPEDKLHDRATHLPRVHAAEGLHAHLGGPLLRAMTIGGVK
jgi:hypothetical protein